MKKNILILFALPILFACKTNKDASASNENVLPTSVPLTSDSLKAENYRLTITFYSIGSGTENNLMNRLEDFIGEYAGKLNKTIDYSKTGWGREGETDYCFKLNELTSLEQSDFILNVKEELKTGKWVHIYQNQPCKHKQKP